MLRELAALIAGLKVLEAYFFTYFQSTRRLSPPPPASLLSSISRMVSSSLSVSSGATVLERWALGLSVHVATSSSSLSCKTEVSLDGELSVVVLCAFDAFLGRDFLRFFGVNELVDSVAGAPSLERYPLLAWR